MTPEDFRQMQLWYTVAFIGTSVLLGLFSIWMYKIGWDKGFESGYSSATSGAKLAKRMRSLMGANAAADAKLDALDARLDAERRSRDAQAILMAGDIPGLDDGIDLTNYTPSRINLLDPDHDSGINLADGDFILTPLEEDENDKLKDDFFIPLVEDDDEGRLI